MLVKKIIFNKGIILDTISTSFSRNILFIRIFLSRKDSFSLYREFSFISFLLGVIIRKTPGLQYRTHTHTYTCIVHIKHRLHTFISYIIPFTPFNSLILIQIKKEYIKIINEYNIRIYLYRFKSNQTHQPEFPLTRPTLRPHPQSKQHTNPKLDPV